MTSESIFQLSITVAKCGLFKSHIKLATLSSIIRIEQLKRIGAPKVIIKQAEQSFIRNFKRCANNDIWIEEVEQIAKFIQSIEELSFLWN